MSVIALTLILFAATAWLQLLADRYAIPLPSLLVLGGVALALIPGLPRPSLDPDAIFLIFVPPLLYWAALTTSLRDLRRNLRAIVLLGVVLVLATMSVVALATHALLPNLSWPMCFLLGAIVSPPDAVAVTAITRVLGLPRDLVMVLEGESLINDATALVAYQLALVAAASGHFSLPQAALRLLLIGSGGIAVGLTAGFGIGLIRRRIQRSAAVENTISLLSPFIAFLPANFLGLSGVLSVVTTGLYLGRHGPRYVSADTRLQANAMWQIVTFLLEGLIFIFIGLELPSVIHGLDAATLRTLALDACLITLAMIALRIAWVFPGAFLPRLFERGGHTRPKPSWRSVLFTGWAGIRGGDSLVIALALPFMNTRGAPLAGRNEVIFITFTIILLTLVVQGFTLRPMIRVLRLRAGGEADSEETHARRVLAQAAAQALDQAARDPSMDPQATEELRHRLQYRLQRLHVVEQPDAAAAATPTEALPSHARLRLAVIAAERGALIDLRDRGDIGDDVLRQLQTELDHEEVLLQRRYE